MDWNGEGAESKGIRKYGFGDETLQHCAERRTEDRIRLRLALIGKGVVWNGREKALKRTVRAKNERRMKVKAKMNSIKIESDLLFETRKYRLTGLEPMLGSQPASRTLRTEFIASKAPSPAEVKEEDGLLGSMEERGLTVFLRDNKDDKLIMLDYMLRGYFKGALEALIGQTGIKMPRSKVDKFLFVGPRRIPILRDGKPIYEEDDQIERPLRAETMRGPRVSLAASEAIDEGWEITIEVTLMPNPESKASKAVTWSAVEMALDYGRFQGLGQWRTGGNGRFIWEQIEDDE